ncbi:isopentenyl phosphate kinase family protein, partial [Candidatus Bathyarchaeota archaeon]|nr:isopentenyl phosphate kinase family protein [Candidatus Bathyarchaeota archaeon]
MVTVDAIVKLGGSVITFKDKPLSVNQEVLDRLAEELSASGLSRLIIVHGGGSFGHPLALKYRLQDGYKGPEQREGVVATHRAMLKLNEEVLKALENSGFKPISIPPLASALASSGRLKRLLHEPFVKALELGFTPVTFGDIVFDDTRGFSIISGDSLMTELSSRLRPSKAVFTVDVDGIYAEDPKLHPDAKLFEEMTADDLLNLVEKTRSKTVDATGGIGLKLKEAYKIASMGLDVYVVNGLKPGRLLKVLKGVRVKCTVVKGVKP